jgi:hypothetical protein
METITDLFSGLLIFQINTGENKYTEFYSSTTEALNFLNPRWYYELYEKG